LERDRHDDLIAELRKAGARVHLIRDGDVAPAIAAARGGTGVDLLMGIGGTPEGVISATAIKCLGGALQGKLWPRNDDERRRLLDAGLDPERVLTTNDLVASDNVFVAATGVTTGALLRGVQYTKEGAITDSIVMRRHGAADRGAPPVREAEPGDGAGLSLERHGSGGRPLRISSLELSAERAQVADAQHLLQERRFGDRSEVPARIEAAVKPRRNREAVERHACEIATRNRASQRSQAALILRREGIRRRSGGRVWQGLGGWGRYGESSHDRGYAESSST
jgi:hypothetical protein